MRPPSLVRPAAVAPLALLALSLLAPAQQPTLGSDEPAAPRVLPYPIDLPPEFEAAIDAGTRTRTGRPGPNHWTNRAHYDLAIELDPETARLQGRAVLTYHNRSPEPLQQLVLHLRQNLEVATAQRTRTVAQGGGMTLERVLLDGEELEPRVRDTRMFVPLAAGLAPGASVTLTIDYSFTVPPAGAAPRMGHENADVYYLGYWYPQFAVHDDVEGWVADRYRGNGEFYMGYAAYDLAITVPAGYIVRATGDLVNPEEVLTEKARAALAQAQETRDIVHVVDQDDLDAGTATQPGGADGRLTWRFRADDVRDAAVSVGRTYLWDATHAVVKDKHGPGKDGRAEIHCVYEADSGDWRRGAEYARHTIEYMSALVHPYPWPHMTACEGIIGGGMEYPMMTICGGRRPAGVIAHELCHMWFPMLLGSNEKRYAWQDEGFTSYFTALVRDDFAGRAIGGRQVALRYAANVSRGRDVVCMRHADGYVDDDFGFAAYGKPAAILHQLRGLLGDETFLAGFRRYAADWAYKHPYPYDFFHTMSDVAGRDLSGYFRTWLYEAWVLDHAIGSVEAKGDTTRVTVVDRGRAVHPCTVEATFADGSTARAVVSEAHWQDHTTATITFQGRATKVEIDPDVATLDAHRDDNEWRAEPR
ncbi:MAG: M1 family metallopeptidase [Planctomycetota bacterium]